MQLHNLILKTKHRRKRRVGRGGKRGTYSGRGIKGMGARAGAKNRPAEREILKKIPKLRGYRFRPFREKPAVVNLLTLARHFGEGETVSPETLLKKGLVQRIKGKMPKVKILGTGELKQQLVFKDVQFSKTVAGKSKIKNQNVP